MTSYHNICKGISKVAWGYFFLYFNISFFGVSILPSFVGYLLFLSAITLLKEEERELSLLYTLGVIMALWTGIDWLASFLGITLEGVWQLADIVIALTNLYFHFQLLTNLASVTAKYQPDGRELDKRLLRYRTLQTVMLTAANIFLFISPWLSEIWTVVISVCIAIVYLIAGICMMKVLFDLRKCLTMDTIKE